MTSALYVLLTLIQGVAHFSNPTSLHNCEEGRSVALYGLTIERKHKADLEAEAAKHAWYNDHPPRMPKTADEWALVAAAKCEADNSTSFCTGSAANANSEAILVDGYYYMIQDDPPQPSIKSSPLSAGEWCETEPGSEVPVQGYYPFPNTKCFENVAVCIPAGDAQ